MGSRGGVRIRISGWERAPDPEWGRGPAEFGILPVALGVALALFAAFVVLVLRRMVLVTLLVLAPLALILWVIPGTESLFKKWFQSYQN